ncbi:MAG: hypothetical protein GEU68_03515 [Actinobacteria bacterium]|jgi:hypothetical protein|nr:hypothetical protein [Actinomycetota bacterium]
MNEGWQFVTVSALVVNALLGFGYRLYRLPRGGTRADVNGQALLGVILIAMAVALGFGAGWPRWPALVYGLLFGIVVMPIWVLAVLIPGSPGRPDYIFTALYWIVLFLIVGGTLAV